MEWKRNNPFTTSENIKDDKLETKYSRTVIDSIDPKKIDQEDFLSSSITSKKSKGFLLLILIFMSLIFIRIAYLQIWKGDYYRERAEGNRIRIQTVKASRGLIYDRNDNLLVKNVPNFTVSAIPGDLPNKNPEEYNETIKDLGQKLDIDEVELRTMLTTSNLWQAIIIKEGIPYDQAINFIINEDKYPGIKCEIKANREYLESEALAHILGYVGKINEKELELYSEEGYEIIDVIGKAGLESYYQNKLRGKDGKKQIEVDSRGRELEILAEEAAQVGEDLYLTIDLDLQKKTMQVLEKYSEAKDSPGGAIVILDPRNGEILALASWPSYDINKFAIGISQEDYQDLINDEKKPLFNRVISGEYPSGSTFKLIVASAALQEGVVNENTTVNSTGGIKLDRLFPDWKTGGHGETNIIKALAESVNTYFYLAGGGSYNAETREITGGLGVDRIIQYAKYFGLYQKSNIDLAGEKDGFLPSREWKKEVKGSDWYLGDTYNISIGQGDILVTPLQVADYTAVIANGGILYQPHLLQSNHYPYAINSNFVSKSNINIVQKGMREAVLSGSAKKLQDLPIDVAAKTGTAEHGGEGENHSWLTAFAPYYSPELVITVLIEEGGEGTESALPAAQEIINWYFNH
jgi:penicillin-binding protein 2